MLLIFLAILMAKFPTTIRSTSEDLSFSAAGLINGRGAIFSVPYSSARAYGEVEPNSAIAGFAFLFDIFFE
jgi:hypothetical protein